MKKIELLRDLQDLDTALDHARGELEDKQARCGDESDLLPLREALDAARGQLHLLQTRGKELDHQLDSETAKRKIEEKKLYDGSVKNPKELASLAHEVELHKAQISELETQALMSMDSLEDASRALQSAQRALAEREQSWKAEQAVLEAECATLTAEVERLAAARGQLAAQLDPVTLRNYEMIRRTRGGVAVVPIEQRACKGCRISLSSSEMQRARSSPEPIACQSCGRILYLP